MPIDATCKAVWWVRWRGHGGGTAGRQPMPVTNVLVAALGEGGWYANELPSS